VEFIPSPIRFASDIFSRVKSAPTRWGGRLQGLGRNLGFIKNTAVPGLKNVKPRGVGLGGPIALLDAGVRVASGENPYLAGGRALSGWGGGALGATLMAPVPVPGARVAGGIGGYGAGTALFDNTVSRATDDRGISGLLRGKGWNNPFAPSPEATRMAGDTSIGSGGFLAPAGYELQGDYTNLSATPPGGNGDIYAGNQGGWVNAPAGYELQGDYTNLPTTPIGDNVFNSEVNIDKKADELSAMREDWLKKTANSPAAKAGISDEGRWGTYLGNQAWRKDHGRSYNTALDPHLRPSSENTRRWE
jgi:hypothetical protein